MNYKKLLLCGYIVLVAALVFKFFVIQGSSESANNLVEVSIENKVINLGNVEINKPAEASFSITNSGLQELILTNVKTDCNCTAPNWSNRPIQPGKTTRIKLVYNSHSPGFFQKKAIVTGNFKGSPLVLIIRGNVIVLNS